MKLSAKFFVRNVTILQTILSEKSLAMEFHQTSTKTSEKEVKVQP